jgi:DUF1365 family protein
MVDTSNNAFRSGIYKGWVRHRRVHPKAHEFRYRTFMMYLDLSELDTVFDDSILWSNKKATLAYFRRSDYMGDPEIPLDESVRLKVKEETGQYPTARICILTNLRYFGFSFNPISCYYIFDENDVLETIISEVSNTPWKEKHYYVLSCDPNKKIQRINFEKTFHVSPFHPMDHFYQWKSNSPDKKAFIHMENWKENDKIFDATLLLERTEITASSLTLTLLAFPFMTLKVVAMIYLQAMKLLVKRIPIHDHPLKKHKNTEVKSQ